MSPLSPRRKVLWSRWLVTLAALLAMAGTARLGWWQLQRADTKEALHQRTLQQSALPPLQALELASTEADAQAQHHRKVELSGQWLGRHTLWLDNRQMDGRPGFFMLTPMLLDDGSAVLVQRGWAPRRLDDRTHLPEVSTPAGRVALTGRVAGPPSRLYEPNPPSGAAPGPIRQNVDMAALATELGRPLRPLSVVQLDTAPGEPADGLRRQWWVPAADVHKHWGYAAQWFALSALVAGLYVWFQFIAPRRR